MSFHQLGVAAFFQDNSALLDLVNSQVLAKPLICLGDGHDGIWNLFRQIGEKQERIEILDWYHLIENLYKVGGSFQGIEEVQCFLEEGGSGGGYLLCAKDGQSLKLRILLFI